ncbi:MAG: hypothetical protein JKX69_06890 [Rhodobacteraceae bacterium]|nr:hypothetical protein [Paracoccaceae bacterium]
MIPRDGLQSEAVMGCGLRKIEAISLVGPKWVPQMADAAQVMAAIARPEGCPYAPDAKGNVATEAVVEMLHAKGFETGIDPIELAAVARFAAQLRSPQ